MFSQPLEIHDALLPISWRRSALDFISQLMKFEPAQRLGSEGVAQIKAHVWLKDVFWKEIRAKS
jgi:hypothetical protein